jgi:hypothetical protein
MADANSLLRLETRDGKNAWYEFKIREMDTAGFLSDVDLVWTQVESDTKAKGSLPLSEPFRFALITASVNSVAGRLPGSVLGALTLRQIWSPLQAVTYATRIPEPDYRIRTLTRLQEVLSGPVREHALEMLLAEALALPVGDFRGDVVVQRWTLSKPQEHWFDRASALSLVAPHLPPHLLARAVAWTNRIPNESAQADALTSMVKYLQGNEKRSAVQMALKVIDNIESPFEKVRRVGELLPEMDAGDYPLLLGLVTRIQHEASQENVLVEVADGLPSEHFESAFAIAKSIKWEGARTRALCSLLCKAPAPFLKHLYSEVIRISDKSERARCLLALGKRLAGPARARAVRIAFEDIVSSKAPADDPVGSRGEGRVTQLIEVAALAASPERESAVQQALEEISNIEHDYRKAEQLRDLAPYCTVITYPTLLRLVGTIESEEWRMHAAEYIAPCLPPDIVDLLVDIVFATKSEYHRVDALSKMIPRCRDKTIGRILDHWDTLTADDSRKTIAVALVPRLTPMSRDLLLSQVEKLRDASARCHALLAFEPYVGRPAATLQKALDAATQIVESDNDFMPCELECKRYDAFMRVTEFFPECAEAYRSALDAVRNLPDEREHHSLGPRVLRPEALLALSERAPEYTLGAILQVAFEIKPPDAREAVFERLAPRLPINDLQQLVSELLRIGDIDAQIAARIALVTHMPQSKTEVHYSDIIRTIALHPSDTLRVEYLSKIADSVPSSLLGQLLTLIQGIQDNWQRHRALFSVFPRVPIDLLDRALSIVDTLSSWDLPECLLGLTSQYPEDRHPEIVKRAIAAAQAIKEPTERAERLWRIARTRNSAFGDELFAAALAEVIRSAQGPDKARLLAEMIDHLPADLQSEVSVMITDSICAIDSGANDGLFGSDGYTRVRAVVEAGPHIPSCACETLFGAFRELQDDAERAECLAALSQFLPEPPKKAALTTALAAAKSIKEARKQVKAYISLAPCFDRTGRRDVLQLALSSASSIDDTDERARSLTLLLGSDEPTGRKAIVDAAFDTAMSMWMEKTRAAALKPLLPYLSESHLRRLIRSMQTSHDPYYQAVVIGLIAAKLPEDLWITCFDLANGISFPSERASALASLGSGLYPPRGKLARRAALQSAMVIEDIQDVSNVCNHLVHTLLDDEIADAIGIVKSGKLLVARLVAALHLAARIGKPSDQTLAAWILEEVDTLNDPTLVVDLLIPALSLVHGPHLANAARILSTAVRKIESPELRYRRYEDVITAIATVSGSVGVELLATWLRELGTRSRAECLGAIGSKVFTVGYHGSLAKELGRESEVTRRVVGLASFFAFSEREIFDVWQTVDDITRWWR